VTGQFWAADCRPCRPAPVAQAPYPNSLVRAHTNLPVPAPGRRCSLSSAVISCRHAGYWPASRRGDPTHGGGHGPRRPHGRTNRASRPTRPRRCHRHRLSIAFRGRARLARQVPPPVSARRPSRPPRRPRRQSPRGTATLRPGRLQAASAAVLGARCLLILCRHRRQVTRGPLPRGPGRARRCYSRLAQIIAASFSQTYMTQYAIETMQGSLQSIAQSLLWNTTLFPISFKRKLFII
jgi:hypothetical protein